MRRVVSVAACGLLLVGCSDDGAGDGSTSSAAIASTTSTAPTAAGEVDDSVVGRYVAALATGDLATANALRCQKGKVPDDALAQFGTEVAALEAATCGTLTLGQVSLVEPMTLGSLYGERPDSQIAFSLDTAQGPTSLLAVAVITEDGEPRLCGEMQEGSPGVQAALDTAVITAAAATIADLSTALPAEIVPGATQVDDAAVTDLAQVSGALAGWTRAWAVAGGGVRVTLFDTETPDTAVTLAKQVLRSPGLDSAEHLAELPNGYQGVSAVAAPWTWVHPASVGSRVDTAAGVVGTVAVVVEVTGVVAGQGHDTVTRAVAALTFP